jgi:hypothetical protein
MVVEYLKIQADAMGRLAEEKLPDNEDEVDNDLGRLQAAEWKVLTAAYARRRELLPGVREALATAITAWDGEGDPLLLAHSFLPIAIDVSGLAGDIHFNSDSTVIWGIEDGSPAIDFLEVMAHEIGHALGLQHIYDVDAIMNPFHGFRFSRNQPIFLLPADIAAIQSLYGAGVGSVDPVPEPSTVALACVGLIVLCGRRLREVTSQSGRPPA